MKQNRYSRTDRQMYMNVFVRIANARMHYLENDNSLVATLLIKQENYELICTCQALKRVINLQGVLAGHKKNSNYFCLYVEQCQTKPDNFLRAFFHLLLKAVALC